MMDLNIKIDSVPVNSKGQCKSAIGYKKRDIETEKKRSMIAFYSKDNGIYREQTLNLNLDSLHNFLIKHIKRNDNVLDLGFGSGREMYFLEKYGCEVSGVDATPLFVDILAKEGKNVFHSVLPELDIPLKEQDVIYSVAMIFHINDKERDELFENIKDYLKDDGKLILSYNTEDRRGDSERFFDKIDVNNLELMLSKHGFKLLEREVFNDAKGRFDWLTDCYQLENKI